MALLPVVVNPFRRHIGKQGKEPWKDIDRSAPYKADNQRIEEESLTGETLPPTPGYKDSQQLLARRREIRASNRLLSVVKVGAK